MYNKLKDCLNSIKSRIDFAPDVAIVLGSGLGGYADKIDATYAIDYSEISGMPTSGVDGHRGRFVFGYVGDKRVVIMQGRVHYYEGYEMNEVVMPIRIMRMLGAKQLILTNAAGGVNDSLAVGDLMALTDHISSFVKSPLIGRNIPELGERFPDMTEVYSSRILGIIEKSARELGIDIKSGVYMQLPGPNYETPAEIRAYRTLGADAVGMSTAAEAIAAKHAGMEIGAISCITNMASGISNNALSHEEVKVVAAKASEKFEKLLTKVVKSL